MFEIRRLAGFTESTGNLSTVYAHKDWSPEENPLAFSDPETLGLKENELFFPCLAIYLVEEDLTEDDNGVPDSGESV